MPEIQFSVIPTPVTPEIVAKLSLGAKLTDFELAGAHDHFLQLTVALGALGPTWRLALDAAARELVRTESYLASRGIKRSTDGDYIYVK